MKQLVILPAVLLLATSLFVTNCSTITVLRTKELNRVRDELDSSNAVRLSEFKETMNARVDSIEMSVDTLRHDFVAFNEQVMNMLRNDRMQIVNSLNRLDRQLSHFESRLEESQFHLQRINKQIGDFGDRTTRVVNQVEGDSVPRDSVPSDSIVQDDIKSRELFELAFRDYMTRKFELAYNGFNELITRYPKSIYVDRSLFYLGMISQSKGEHQKAIAYYKRLISEFPISPYARSSHIKIGESYSSMGERDKAINFYNTIIERFPDSPESRIARERLQALQ